MNTPKKWIKWSIITVLIIAILSFMKTAAATFLITAAGAAFLGYRSYKAHRLGFRLRRLIYGLLALMFIISLFGQLATAGKPQRVVTQQQQPKQEEKQEQPKQEEKPEQDKEQQPKTAQPEQEEKEQPKQQQPQTVQPQPEQPKQETQPQPEQQPQAYYKNCTEAKAAGAAPIHKGQAGYSTKLDRDGDGVACDR